MFKWIFDACYIGKCLLFSVNIKVCQPSFSSQLSYPVLYESLKCFKDVKFLGSTISLTLKCIEVRKHFIPCHSPSCASKSSWPYSTIIWKWLASTRRTWRYSGTILMKCHALFVILEKAAKFENCRLLQIIGGTLGVNFAFSTLANGTSCTCASNRHCFGGEPPLQLPA